MGQPWPLFSLFSSFQTHITIFTTNRYVKKCPCSIQSRYSNSQPLEHDSSPITTRPGLPSAPVTTVSFEQIKVCRISVFKLKFISSTFPLLFLLLLLSSCAVLCWHERRECDVHHSTTFCLIIKLYSEGLLKSSIPGLFFFVVLSCDQL